MQSSKLNSQVPADLYVRPKR